jgi:cyclopropane fatty-acyl-phospholipid synthase-like methyltransferase
MARMSLEDFEARYRADPDPWGYTSSEYERRKYDATLAACGDGPFADALELGGSIGVFSALLASRCERLTTIDAAPTAVAAARRRLGDAPHIDVILGEIPDAIPIRAFDLVVASEILYYLTASGLARTLRRLESVMVVGARLVAVHWRPAGPERPLDAGQAHTILREQPWLESLGSNGQRDEYRLDVLERM